MGWGGGTVLCIVESPLSATTPCQEHLLFPDVTTKNVFRHSQPSPGEQNHPQVRTVGLKQALSAGRCPFLPDQPASQGHAASDPGQRVDSASQINREVSAGSQRDMGAELAGFSRKLSMGYKGVEEMKDNDRTLPV